MSYLKKKEIFNYFLNNYDDYFFINELINIAEYNLADFKLLKITTKKRDNLIKKNYYDKDGENFIGKSFYSFGHLIWFIDTQHRKNLLGIKDNRKIIISENYISNRFLGMYLKYLYPERVEINNKKFKEICNLNKWSKFPETNDYILDEDSIYGLPNREYKKFGKLSKSWDENVSKKIINDFNLKVYKHKKPYVCFFNRDNNFKKQNDIIDLDSDRTNDPNKYIPLFKEIINSGYDIIYMGSLSQKKINFKHNSFFKYCHSEHNNDFNDLIISQNCEFFLYSGQSGPINLSLLSEKYSLNLEYPFNRKPPLNPKAFYHIRPMRYKNKKLLFDDYFNNELFSCHDFRTLYEKNYSLENSSSDEMISSYKKFLHYYENNKNFLKKYNYNDREFYYNILN